MKFKAMMSALALCAGMTVAMPAMAAINLPVPANARIVFGGLEWAWAGPCAATGNSCGPVDLSYQGTLGWRLPTAEEMVGAPSAMNFLFAGANVPLGGFDPISGANFQYTSDTLNNDGALATPYFNDVYSHGDWCNAPGSACGFGEESWSPSDTQNSYSEALVVRGLAPAVPEPATWAMMIGGIAVVGAGLRGRRRTTVSFA